MVNIQGPETAEIPTETITRWPECGECPISERIAEYNRTEGGISMVAGLVDKKGFKQNRWKEEQYINHYANTPSTILRVCDNETLCSQHRREVKRAKFMRGLTIH